MNVVKRDGRVEEVAFDKITARLRKLCDGIDTTQVDVIKIAQQVVPGLYNGVSTAKLDELAAETAAYMTTQHPDYSKLAARIEMSNLHKMTPPTFSAAIAALHALVDESGAPAPVVSDELARFVAAEAASIDAACRHERDFEYDFFGVKTLMRSYLLRVGGEIVERPQYMLLRVALAIHIDDLPAALHTYELLSTGNYIHATPTLFNAGTRKQQMSSCFLLTMKEDSIDGIYETLKLCANISKHAGGIGVDVTKIRATGAHIKGSGGTSTGIVPMLRVYDATARYVDQGGGKRKGGFAMYIEPWHGDIYAFLELRKNHGKEEARARDLFYGLWIPDLFMRRVEQKGEWTLFCPNACPELRETWGAEFDAHYERYEAAGAGRRTVKAHELWHAVLTSQIETGLPYLLFKDACNGKSNQQNLGTIHCSNLCTEIIEYTAPDEVAVCNLASIALPKMVVAADAPPGADAPTGFDFEKLRAVTRVVTRNLNRVIDLNFYPVEEARTSNLRHRPIGLGVQGLADVFMMLELPDEAERARALHRGVFETIYYAALEESCALAEAHGAYASFAGSPASRGVLQFDMWGVEPSARWDWAGLKARIVAHGLRNSLLVAPMPTASTAQILGNNECFEPYTSNLYVRRVMAGDFSVVNAHLLRALVARGLWTEALRDEIVAAEGSVQKIERIPREVREVFKTAWEIKMRAMIDMAADRGAFIDQSQSFNAFVQEASYAKLHSMHLHSWRRGLKTGMYYLRTQAATRAVQYTVSSKGGAAAEGAPPAGQPVACMRDNPECEACGA